MRDLHDPNNPGYEKESELTREIIYGNLTDEEITFLEDEQEYLIQKSAEYLKRIGKIKLELNLLMDIVRQLEDQTLILKKLEKIVTL